MVTTHEHVQMMAPANTPATPPNFPETLMAFSKLSAGEHSRATTSPPGHVSCLTASPASSSAGANAPSSVMPGRAPPPRFCPASQHAAAMPLTSPFRQ